MELFHVMNRRVDGLDLFLVNADYARFVHDLFEFNDSEAAGKTYRSVSGEGGDIVSPHIRKQIVEIHGWCLMKNHYHLLLSEKVAGGISLFLRKLNVGYAKYFNEHYKRCGTLFQGRTKKVSVERNAHFLYILHYIHLNPLDYFKGNEGWREREKGGIRNVRGVLAYLQDYRWSSYLDYCETKNFPSILTTSLFRNKEVFGDYGATIKEYVQDMELDTIRPLLLE